MANLSIAQSEAELKIAEALVRKTYLAMGYILAEDTHNDISRYLGEPQTTTLQATLETGLVGTISLIRDSVAKLPIDSIYQSELDKLRQPNQLIAEVCQLAVDKNISVKETAVVTLKLLAHVVFVAQHCEVDTLVFAVNPKHCNFYKLIGCKQFGTEKKYPGANNHPAVAFHLDVKAATTGHDSFLRDILLTPPEPEFLAGL